MAKQIFVTGGVVSSLGKGLTSASIGMLLEKRGLSVRMQKLDPYIDVVAVTWRDNSRRPAIEHFPNAYEPTGRGQVFA